MEAILGIPTTMQNMYVWIKRTEPVYMDDRKTLAFYEITEGKPFLFVATIYRTDLYFV
jgi:hypothetical protein